jgi:CheY-like chemotaxis protein
MSRILVVEDEAIVSSNIVERLAALGYQLAGRAACTEQVLEQVETQHPDLVLMDVHLAGNGDWIKIAKEIHQKFHLPCIFLSTFSEKEIFKRAKVSELYGYLLKPFEDRELKLAIESAHYKHQADAEIRRLTGIFKDAQ